MLSTDANGSDADVDVGIGLDTLVTRVLGQSVFLSTAGNGTEAGIIADMVIAPGRGISTVVIRVAGSIVPGGTKAVAIDFAHLQWAPHRDGDGRWVLNVPAAVLVAAPSFIWSEYRKAATPAVEPASVVRAIEPAPVVAGSPANATEATPSQGSFDQLRTGRTAAAVRGAIWSVVSSFAPAAFGILVFMATSRVLMPAEFGLVALAASIATLGTAIAPAGFGEALIQRHNIGRHHLDAVFWLCVGSALLIYAVLLAAAGPVSASLGQPQLQALICFIGLRVIFDMGAAVPNALLTRSMSFKKLAVRTTVASLVAAIGCLALLWMGFGLWALAFSQLATAAVACVGAMFSARWWPSFRLSFGALRELGSFGLFASGNRLITMLSVDQILIGTLLGPAGLGIYGFARRIFQILSDLITGALSSVSYSLLSSMQREPDKLREAYLFATFASAVVSFPVFVGLALIADDFVPLAFGPNWTEAIPVVQAFCALGLLTSIGVLQSSLVKSQGQANLWFYYLLAKQIGTILYVLLFHSWGVTALATAIVIQNYVMWPPAVHMVVRILRISPWKYLSSLATPAFATVLMLGAGMATKMQLSDAEPVLRLGATIGVSAVVYAMFLVLFARKRLFQMKASVLKR